MLAYLALDSNFEAATTPVNTTDIPVSAVIKIEKMVKQFKTHRCALDFDGGFIKSTVLRTWIIIIIIIINDIAIMIIIVAVKAMIAK